jgi:DNA-binding LytR/AlgR family response regulator
MKIKCVITEDEPVARKGLQGYVEKIDFLQLEGLCEDVLHLNSLLKEKPVDLLFLDIEMPYISGIDFLLNHANPPKVIFTTAFESYAIKAFELDVLDYLLKPISFERFLKAANKAFDFFREHEQKTSPYIFVKADQKLEKITIADIILVEALQNYVAIYTKEKKYITLLPLKTIQERLPGNEFIQPHKSWLVAIDKINSIEGNTIHISGFQVPISKYSKDEVMQKLVNNQLLRK